MRHRSLWMLSLVLFLAVTVAYAQTTAPSEAPRIVSLEPLPGATDVDPAVTEIRVTFDRPMQRSFSFTGGGPSFPKTTGRPTWVTPTTCVLPVTLAPGRMYAFGINGPGFTGFRSEDGVAAAPLPVLFATQGLELPKLTPRDVAALWAALETAIVTRYAYAERTGTDWRARFRAARDRSESITSSLAFVYAAREVLAPADDPHLALEVTPGGRLSLPVRASKPNFDARIVSALVPNVKRIGRQAAAGRFDDGIGYVLIPTWGDAIEGDLPAIQKTLDDFHDAPGLIIDVRPNGGGDEGRALRIAGRFVTKPVVYARHRVVTRPPDLGFEPWQTRTLLPDSKRGHIAAPVVVLTGGSVMSSNEAFVLMMRQAPNVRLVGATTYGSSGNPQPFRLGYGVKAYVPSWQAADAAGVVFEGVGIAPDVVVEETPGAGADPVLARGLELLRAPR